MLSSYIAYIAIFLSLIIAAWYRVKYRHFYALVNKMPIHRPCLPILGNFLVAIKLDLNLIKISNYICKSGNFLCFWACTTPYVLITDPEFLQIFYTDNSLLNRSTQFEAFNLVLGANGVIGSNGDVWKKARTIMTQTFSTIDSEIFLEAMTAEVDILVEKLRQFVGQGYFAFSPHMRYAGNSAVTRISINEKLSDNRDLENIVDSVEELFSIAARHSMYSLPTILSLYNQAFYFVREYRRLKVVQERFRSSVKDILIRKESEMKDMLVAGRKPPNFYIYNLMRKYGDEPLDDLITHVISTYAASVDTVTGTVGFVLHMLCFNPEWQGRIFEEDCRILKRLNGRRLEIADFKEYEVLERVIKETLRLIPALPLTGRMATKDIKMGEYVIPAGMNICALLCVTFRREDIFKNPMKFDPDRFLPENIKNLHPFAFNPFSAGPRSCMGAKFGMHFVKIAVSSIIRNFKVYNEYRDFDELDDNLVFKVTTKDKKDVRIRLEKR